MKRKYEYFILATEYETLQFNSYKDAFASYHSNDIATLYGTTENGEMIVIFSK